MRQLRLAILALPVLAACGQTREVQNSEYYDDSQRGRVTGRLSGNQDGLLILGTDRSRGREGGAGNPGDGGAMGVNVYLWRASLDTLSFMPLASADPYGGVIITDWYSPAAAQGERFRATAYILGRQLRSDGVRVTVFRQEMRNGQWMDAPTAAGTSTEMEDKVLARARELRSQSAAL